MKVNGKEFKFTEGMTVDSLIDILKLNKDKLVIELDGEIIPKEDFFKTNLKESNIVEVISFVGGG